MKFSESSPFHRCPGIMAMLAKTNMPNTKEFLRGKYKLDDVGRIIILAGKENKDDLELLKVFGEHTLECLLVHTLSYLVNIDNMVSLASLIDQIESSVRQHARCLFKQRGSVATEKDFEKKKKSIPYPFGTALVEFLVERKLLVIFTEHFDHNLVQNKGKNYYSENFNYAACTFDTALLSVRLSLPIVSPHLDWMIHPPADGNDIRISDI